MPLRKSGQVVAFHPLSERSCRADGGPEVKETTDVELNELISLVRNSNKPVREVIETYMASGWSLLTDQWNRKMTDEQKTAFINKLEQDTHG